MVWQFDLLIPKIDPGKKSEARNIFIINKPNLNPIPAGVLQNQDTLGGGGFKLTPRYKSHVRCSNMTSDKS